MRVEIQRKTEEKPSRQGKYEVKINDNAKPLQMQKLWKTLKNYEKLHASLCQDETKKSQINSHTKWSQMSDLFSDNNVALAETDTS